MSYPRQSLIAAALLVLLPLDAAAQENRYPPGPDDYNRQPLQQQNAPPVPACRDCGTVDSVRTVEQAGEGSGVGMVAGGVVGGLLGHQVGQGRGNTAATILGAAGGALAGHQVEKTVKKALRYDVSVRMDDGTMRTVAYQMEPGFRTGDRVRLVDGKLSRN